MLLQLVRRILRQAFEILKENSWDDKLISEFGNILLETVLKPENSTYLGLTMHITEIYLEELAKVMVVIVYFKDILFYINECFSGFKK